MYKNLSILDQNEVRKDTRAASTCFESAMAENQQKLQKKNGLSKSKLPFNIRKQAKSVLMSPTSRSQQSSVTKQIVKNQNLSKVSDVMSIMSDGINNSKFNADCNGFINDDNHRILNTRKRVQRLRQSIEEATKQLRKDNYKVSLKEKIEQKYGYDVIDDKNYNEEFVEPQTKFD